MMSIMNLVRESKIKGISESEIWKALFQHRWDIEILKTNSCLTENQTAEMIYKIGQDLNLNYGSSLWIPEEDIRLGTELYSVFSCPARLLETVKLSKLFE